MGLSRRPKTFLLVSVIVILQTAFFLRIGRNGTLEEDFVVGSSLSQLDLIEEESLLNSDVLKEEDASPPITTQQESLGLQDQHHSYDTLPPLSKKKNRPSLSEKHNKPSSESNPSLSETYPKEALKGSSVPFVQVYHPGCPLHLRQHLWQVSRSNNRVILVGDVGACAGFCKRYNIELYAYENYKSSALEFGHLFPNTTTSGEVWEGRRRNFELQCYERWFALYEFMTRHSIDRVFYGDADTMIYYNLTEVVDKIYPDTDLALMYLPPRVTISFAIMSQRGLLDMLSFISQTFREWKEVFAPNVGATDFHAHVNDMNVMRLWALKSRGLANVHCVHLNVPPGDHQCLSKMYFSRAEHIHYQPTIPFKTLADINGGLLFDNNIGTDDHNMFEVLKLPRNNKYNVPAFKRLKWTGTLGLPHFTLDFHKFANGTDSPIGSRAWVQIPAAGVHFQGAKKKLMTYFMRDLRLKSCNRATCSCVTMGCEECVSDCDRSSIVKFMEIEEKEASELEIVQSVLKKSRKSIRKKRTKGLDKRKHRAMIKSGVVTL